MGRYNQPLIEIQNTGDANISASSDMPISGSFGSGNIRFFGNPGTQDFTIPATTLRVRMWAGGNNIRAGSFVMGILKNLIVGQNLSLKIGAGVPGFVEGANQAQLNERIVGSRTSVGNLIGVSGNGDLFGTETPLIHNLGGSRYGAGAASLIGAGANGATPRSGGDSTLVGPVGNNRGGAGACGRPVLNSNVGWYPSSGFTGRAAKMQFISVSTGSVIENMTSPEIGDIRIDYIGTGGGGDFEGANGGGAGAGNGGFPGGGAASGSPAGGLIIIEW